MGVYVHVHVCFACDDNEPVAALAARHAPHHRIDAAGAAERAARWFLDDLAGRRGENVGPKGGLSLWGMIGNHTNVDEFCERLRPFWTELLATPNCGPLRHEHIIVFEEREQTEQAVAYEIGLHDRGRGVQLVITRHELPFAWQQF